MTVLKFSTTCLRRNDPLGVSSPLSISKESQPPAPRNTTPIAYTFTPHKQGLSHAKSRSVGLASQPLRRGTGPVTGLAEWKSACKTASRQTDWGSLGASLANHVRTGLAVLQADFHAPAHEWDMSRASISHSYRRIAGPTGLWRPGPSGAGDRGPLAARSSLRFSCPGRGT